MKNISQTELSLHSYLLRKPGTESTTRIIEAFSDHLIKYLQRCYKKHDVHIQFINEAVYNALEWYCEHPMMFHVSQGSLRSFLELRADRNLQHILEREKQHIHISGVRHMLASYFDNEQDIQVARLLLKNDHELTSYLPYADTGVLRFNQVRSEIQRIKNRVQDIIRTIPNLKPVRTSELALLIAFDEPALNPVAYRQVGL